MEKKFIEYKSEQETVKEPMATEIPRIYNPKDVEDRLYSYWEEKGFFKIGRAHV